MTVEPSSQSDPAAKNGPQSSQAAAKRLARYHALLQQPQVNWNVDFRLIRRLGAGGQGVVFLAERLGAYGGGVRVALKFFSPEKYPSLADYHEDMRRVAEVAVHVARSQQDHLLDIHNFVDTDGIMVMVMEWVDGFDLAHLLSMRLRDVRPRISNSRWEYINDVVVTDGPDHLQLKPGIAIAVLRDCLAALASMHAIGVVHGDIKPGNIMLKRTGHSKIIDLGSSFQLDQPLQRQTWTPRYAAFEVLNGRGQSYSSDLGSLGYVLLEMLTGRNLFEDVNDLGQMLKLKRQLPDQLEQLLPDDVLCNDLLMKLISDLISDEPERRTKGAEAAQIVDNGAAQIQRQLVLGDLASEYDSEIRSWLADYELWCGDLTEEVASQATPSFFVNTSGIELIAPATTVHRAVSE